MPLNRTPLHIVMLGLQHLISGVVSRVIDWCVCSTGDRLISVNDVDLEGLPHSSAIQVLHNAPDDVALVVSQPKERLYEGRIVWQREAG